MKKLLLLILCSFLTLSCLEPPDADVDDDFDFPDTETCSFSAIASYDIGVDVTSDFSETNVYSTHTVQSSNCTDVYQGETSTSDPGNVSRSGNTITFSGDGGSESITVKSDGINTTLPMSGSVSSNGTTIKITFLTSKLNTSAKTIEMTYKSTVTRPIGSYYSSLNHQKSGYQFTYDFYND